MGTVGNMFIRFLMVEGDPRQTKGLREFSWPLARVGAQVESVTCYLM